eukprot:7222816-Pyramimonas_sp.AAC.1
MFSCNIPPERKTKRSPKSSKTTFRSRPGIYKEGEDDGDVHNGRGREEGGGMTERRKWGAKSRRLDEKCS